MTSLRRASRGFLVDEVADALTERLAGRRALEDHAAGHVEVGTLVEEVLRAMERGRILGQDDLNKGGDLLIELIRFTEVVDEVVPFRRRPAEQSPGEVPLLRLAPSSELGELGGAARTRA